MSHQPQKSHQVDIGGVDVQFIALIINHLRRQRCSSIHAQQAPTNEVGCAEFTMLTTPFLQRLEHRPRKSSPFQGGAVNNENTQEREEESKDGKPHRRL